MGAQPLSLKARAIALLAQREHSVSELRGKLLRLARTMAAAAEVAARDGSVLADSARPADAADRSEQARRLEEQVDALLAWLQAQGYLDETRFVESRLHARMRRYGNLRIKQELAQHGLALGAEQQAELKDSELARARDVWARKFAAPPADAAARAKHGRFLVGRGFSPEVIRRLLRQVAAEADEPVDEVGQD